MANAFSLTDVGHVFAELANRDTGLIARTFRDAEAEFGKGVGTSVDIRRYATKANSITIGNTSTALTVSDVNESIVPVTLTDNVHVRTLLSNADELSLTDFSRQVTAPAVTAMNATINAKIAAIYNAVTASATVTYTATNPVSAIVSARAALRTAGVPNSAALFVEASPAVYADLLNANAFSDAEASRMANVQVFESNRITAGFVMHTRDAVGVALRAPAGAVNAPESASIRTEEGFAIGLARAYSPEYGREDVLHTVLVGVTAMPLVTVDEATGDIVETEGGNVIKVTEVPAG